MRRRWARGLALVLAVGGSGACMAEPERLQRTDDATLMVLKDPRIQESSGLARSVRHQGVLYTHNDAGHDPVVFAVGSDGETRAALDLHGAPAADWEDIAVTGDGRVWVGDIGGNAKGRSTVSVVVFQEPKRLVDGAPDWVEYKLDYPDGRHNAEAILVNPETFRVYVVSKGPPGESMVYVAPRKLERTRPNRLKPLTPAPPSITAGSFAPDDSGGFALRNYRFAFIYDRWDEEPRQIELPRIPAGESLAMRADGDLLIGSEGPSSEVVQVPDTSKPSG